MVPLRLCGGILITSEALTLIHGFVYSAHIIIPMYLIIGSDGASQGYNFLCCCKNGPFFPNFYVSLPSSTSSGGRPETNINMHKMSMKLKMLQISKLH